MKKAFCFVLSVITILICFQSCAFTRISQPIYNDNDNLKFADKHDRAYVEDMTGSADPNGSRLQSPSTSNKLDPALIDPEYDVAYSDGLLLVKLKQTGDICCTDKEGNIRFTVYESAYNEYFVSCGFNGKHAVIEAVNKKDPSKTEYLLCNRSGQLISAGRIGADSFVFDLEVSEDMFRDGYLLAIKSVIIEPEVETDKEDKENKEKKEKTVEQMAVFNSDLEVVSDFSEAFFSAYSKGKFNCYSDGFLYQLSRLSYLDLNTGNIGEDKRELRSRMPSEHKSDFWELYSSDKDKYGIFDSRDMTLDSKFKAKDIELAIDLAPQRNYIHSVAPFNSGSAGVVFKDEEERTAPKYYFTLIDESGSFMFEPEKVPSLPQVSNENDLWVVCSSVGSWVTHVELLISVYDHSGKIATLDFSEKLDGTQSTPSITISEGVIVLRLCGKNSEGKVFLFDTQLKPLF